MRTVIIHDAIIRLLQINLKRSETVHAELSETFIEISIYTVRQLLQYQK